VTKEVSEAHDGVLAVLDEVRLGAVTNVLFNEDWVLTFHDA
jgi:hypothetical protein